MSEEAEVSEVEVSEPEGGDVFDMEGAVESIGGDLFEKSIDIEDEEVEIDVENEVKEEKEPDEVEKQIKEELDKVDDKVELPASWKKDMEDKWSKLDPDMQKYVMQREDQMKEGLDKDRGDANLGRMMRDKIKPYEAMLGKRGIEAPQAVEYLLQNHQMLSEGTQEQKITLLNQLAKSYGVGVKKGETTPEIDSLAQRLEIMEQNQNASHQRTLQETTTRVEGEVSTFAQDHPHFDELSDDMIVFINNGDDLEVAYNKALKLSDDIQEKDFDKRVEERLTELKEKEKQEAAEAKKAKSVNVRGLHTKKTPTATKGKMFDDMPDIYEGIKAQ